MTRILIALLAGLVLALPARAQRWSGDPWLDSRLDEVSVYARVDLDGFIDEVVVSFGAPRPVVHQYVVDYGYAPADVYLMAGYAKSLGLPLSSVHDTWRANRGQGWGAVAKELGIKPGSPAFHALKGTVKSRAPHWKGGTVVVHDGPDRGPLHGPPGNKGKGHGKAKGRGKGKGRD